MFGDRPALVSDERSLSYSELYDEVSLCAAVWSGLGLNLVPFKYRAELDGAHNVAIVIASSKF